jgi:predicted dehydrogenase
MEPLRIGLIGAGKHGVRYARHVATDVPACRLVALCRRDAGAGAEQARELGCRFHGTYADLVASPDVDAVAVVVPPVHHPAICEAAARAGKAILLEKPMAVSVGDARRIRRALDRHPVPFVVAHTLRFNTVVRALRERVAGIAPVHSLYLSQRFEPSSLEWLDDPSLAGGGNVIHTGVHSFDLLRFLTDSEADGVACRTWRAVTRRTEDNFVAQITLGGGRIAATVVGSRSTESRNGLVEIAGAGGQLVGDHAHHFAYAIHGTARTPIALDPPVPTVRETLRAFVDTVRGRAPAPITWDDGHAAVAIAEACYRSAANGGAPVAPVAARPL